MTGDPLAPNGPLALWRDPSPKAVAARLANRSAANDLALLVTRVRPAAREIARVLDLAEGPALVGAALDSRHPATPRRTTMADDLIATALLLDAKHGDPTARLVVDHLRRRRCLAPLWPSPEGRRAASRPKGKRNSTPAPEAKIIPFKG